MLGYSYAFYDAERLGQVPANSSVPWRGPSLLYERGPMRLGFGTNLTGGWEAGGLAGTLKLTMPTAFTVAMLAWGLLEFPQARSRTLKGMPTRLGFREPGAAGVPAGALLHLERCR